MEVDGDGFFLGDCGADVKLFADHFCSPTHIICPCAIIHYADECDFATF